MPWLLAVVLALTGCATGLTQQERHKIDASTYVVTGASSGIGRQVALELARYGANVVLAARRTELLEQVAGEVRSTGGEALAVTTDVSDPQDVTRLAELAVERFGRIDVWINNAGVTAVGRFRDIPVEDHARLVDVNLKGVIYGSHVALRQFDAQGGGTLVNIGSLLSQVPLANQASYSASKAAILSLGRAINEELRLDGADDDIRVVTILPWAVDTPIWEHAANYSGRDPRLRPMDEPERVARIIVEASLGSRAEVAVGWKARGVRLVNRAFPGITRWAAANVYQSQLNDASAEPVTQGALHEPMPQAGDGR
ncbi:SDR family NAD(P)-dependent oxidoreductase [Billgrantia saliphila]|uniref:SDR family NAD(P)-dependent oxidoreductase n=1 Tax=Billgrantia saliphila TaxID=1848458 RepID=UPI0018CC1B4F|nr:SDR family NAD(P)-dependent oxidoreductase [Halomonas saliphila]